MSPGRIDLGSERQQFLKRKGNEEKPLFFLVFFLFRKRHSRNVKTLLFLEKFRIQKRTSSKIALEFDRSIKLEIKSENKYHLFKCEFEPRTDATLTVKDNPDVAHIKRLIAFVKRMTVNC